MASGQSPGTTGMMMPSERPGNGGHGVPAPGVVAVRIRVIAVTEIP